MRFVIASLALFLMAAIVSACPLTLATQQTITQTTVTQQFAPAIVQQSFAIDPGVQQYSQMQSLSTGYGVSGVGLGYGGVGLGYGGVAINRFGLGYGGFGFNRFGVGINHFGVGVGIRPAFEFGGVSVRVGGFGSVRVHVR